MGKPKILIVDDEVDILDLLEYNLQKEGYKTIRAGDGLTGIEKAGKHLPDLILLDVMMPNLDGIETCRRIRETAEGKKMYIIFLTARAEEYSEVAGFEAGADDYIAKPIKPRVLISRIKAILRRNAKLNQEQDETGIIEIHDLQIIRDEFLIYQGKKAINLPKKEFELLSFLASHPGKVFGRSVLLERVWGTDVLVVDRTIDVHIRKLREKLGQQYIQTIKGVGYKFAQEL